MSVYLDTIESLSSIGNRVGSDTTTSSNYNSINWDVTRFNDIIGWFSTGDKSRLMTVLSNPFQNSRNGTEVTVSWEDGRSNQKIVISKTETSKIYTTYTLGQKCYEVKYNGKIYKTGGVCSSFPGKKTITVNNKKIEIIIEGNGKAYYTGSKIYTSEPFIYSTNNKTTGVPFYCYYKADNHNRIYIGIKLQLKNGNDIKNINGWILAYSEYGSDPSSLILRIKEKTSDKAANVTTSQSKVDEEIEMLEQSTSEEDPGMVITAADGTTEWENSQGYTESLYAADSQAQFNYWEQLYGAYMGGYSLKSHRSIIGLPLQFMGNVDMRVGSSTYGKQYMEDILYDMSVACIKPGGPVLNPKFEEDTEYSDDLFSSLASTYGKIKAYWDSISEHGAGNTLKQYIYTLFKGGSARFYSFQSDYTHYSHYVDTLCHLFITYLGIGNKKYRTSTGAWKEYCNYSDDPAEIETDGGLGLHHQMGWDNAVYMYYSPESSINHTFSNQTMESTLNATMQEGSKAAKEWGFFINAVGLEKGNGLTTFGQNLVAQAQNDNILGRLFGNAAEGVTTILAGNNLSLPEIYDDSDTTTQHTFKVKLASPYGDPESVFLFVLRPLARLLAFSLPRQYGPNSYTSPFIVQAFSKGQFNCQLGIVTELSITRCGNGGESHTINHIPTELEVTLTIADMYEKVFLSNEYFGNTMGRAILGGFVDLITGGTENVGAGIGTVLAQTRMTLTATRLLFNNVGLIDFVASFCGANLNQPTYMTGWTVIYNMMKNRSQEMISYSEQDGWKFPQWEKQLNDAYHDAVTNLYSNITTTA